MGGDKSRNAAVDFQLQNIGSVPHDNDVHVFTDADWISLIPNGSCRDNQLKCSVYFA